MRHIVFNDKKIDSLLFMELLDLSVSLSKIEQLEVEYAFKSYFDPFDKVLYISLFWDTHPTFEKIHGLKSDVYIRSLGNVPHTNYTEVLKFLKKIKKAKHGNFLRQLFSLLEDLRVEELIKKERTGTVKSFEIRREEYRKYFRSQLTVNNERNIRIDALYNLIYIVLTTNNPLEEIPIISDEINLALPYIRSECSKCYEATSTNEIIQICVNVQEVIEDILDNDMLNLYFFTPDFTDKEIVEEGLNFDDIKRKSKLQNDDESDKDKTGEEDIHEDKLPTWHRESETNTQSFLQFDLESGAKTDLMGEGVREGEDGDQALGIVQGSSQQSSKNDFSPTDSLEVVSDDQMKEGGKDGDFGKENKFAYPVFLQAQPVLREDKQSYNEFQAMVSSYQKKLKQMIEKTLEHKLTSPRSNLHFGRLSKNLLPWFTDESPRMFYKKNAESMEIDAVFTLLVDCSASMFDKMDETKYGITLFHEALKSVKVPHEVVGFWEDTNNATEISQPNYFKTVIDFHSSSLQKTGPEILQLQPEEDNRDGYAIRHMANRLLHRNEKQKFLLVFSDGEPAAMNYEQNGIVDTHEAVMNARKQGIEVINVFLSNGVIEESQRKTIQNMYGKYSILVPNIDELPDVLFPLLKKLLLKSI
ncbi:vWA domain-containing protein [Sutcliffiella sp. NC1]|uniref:vWA domain-containing protein n=1 Tax=Sutcliffiella sp. NC1 TaxID=3004096 RepID=UPI0022DDEB2C|nr:VWA domain-containing protein [Sutcliffiella sp. NC1]WBL13028.1 VWA domain-containing protein [Sutcliffiella sp. NC1]